MFQLYIWVEKNVIKYKIIREGIRGKKHGGLTNEPTIRYRIVSSGCTNVL